MFRRGGRAAPSLRRALFILPFWITSVLWMWSWWFTSDYKRFWPIFVPLSLALLYEFAILPSIFLYFVIRAKYPKRRMPLKDRKVAVISLCVPSSESLDIVERQLKAMSKIKYQHDSWILDEGNSEEIKGLARKYGVNHFSRKGRDEYNQPNPPFKAKTKAGNVNAWLDYVKDLGYEYFVQLDIDHIPKPNYLNKTLGFFRDPNVAWVQAPSVYKNLDNWTARGAAEQELTLQGPLQMGFYGHSKTPFIIGSHCTYRMSAIREIGGFQPTRAEDHLDTVYLANKGYSGVFLPEVIAEGDGPETLSTYLAQQFAWAYSMFQVLMFHTPKMIKAMPWKRKLQFLFAQTWYPFWSLSYLLLFTSPIIALIAGRDIAQVNPESMFYHFIPTFICSYLVWLAARPIMQPRKLHLSWRGVILHAVRWPVILLAIFAAAFRIKKPYMITPKGSFAHDAPSLKTYKPFLILGIVSTANVIITTIMRHGQVPIAQAIYSVINAIFMLTICLIDLSIRFRSSKPNLNVLKQYWLKPISATMVLLFMLITTIVLSPYELYPLNAEAVQPIAKPSISQSANYNQKTSLLIEEIRRAPSIKGPTPSLGMYNQSLDLPNTKQPYIEHSFVDWRDDHYFAYVVAKTLQSGNTPLITVEPRGQADGQQLLTDIAAGKYDNILANLNAATKASKSPIYIRFGHEMELVDLYPWGNQDPQLYVSAYQHVVDYMRSNGSDNVKFVWSPAGNEGAEAYYPGDQYVDVIGSTVLYDQYWYGEYVPSFNQLASNRLWLQQYNKPVWIVEFGAGKSNRIAQLQLINEAETQYKELGFSSVVYLNLVDANIVGPDYTLNSINDFGNFFRTDN
jgi:cellulose synthase (UDP-forming)